MDEEKKEIIKFLIAYTAGLVIGIGIYSSRRQNSVKLPSISRENIQEGFAKTSTLELLVRDKDNNGRMEVYLNDGKTEYGIMARDGKLELREYTLRPAVLVPK